MKEIEIKELINYINPLECNEKPAIAMADNGKRINGLTIGWFEVGSLWRKKAATVYINKQRYSKEIFDDADYYSVCFFGEEHKDALRYFGTVSGRNEDKVKGSGLTLVEDVAPYFEECSVVIICRKMGQNDFDIEHVDPSVYDWYKRDGVHTLYHGEIVKVLVKD